MTQEKLIVLGTGNAMVTKCYNTCFALDNGEEYFLVDTGGGNGILGILDNLHIKMDKIHHLFISHEHTDHVLGAIWVIRKIGTMLLNGKYENTFHIYAHAELIETIKTISQLTLQKKITNLFDDKILFTSVTDHSTQSILNYQVTFFDIHSTKAKQFGFKLTLSNSKVLSFMGDEPYNPLCEKYIKNSDWLLSEAFCLYSERERFKPYEKHHSTVKEAAELATQMNIKNLVLWHTEDKNITNRKELYTLEGKDYFKGNLFVPNDLETIIL